MDPTTPTGSRRIEDVWSAEYSALAFALEIAGGAGEECDVVDRARHVEFAGQADRLARDATFQLRDLHGPVRQQPCERGQYRRTIGRGRAGPLGVRVPGSLDGAVDVLSSGLGDFADDLAGARVANDAGPSAQGVTDLAVDELAHRCPLTLRGVRGLF
jgi:hypothetical protein